MHSYKDYWNKIIGDDTKERAMEEIVCGALEKLKMHCPDLFYRTLYDLHCVAYGPHARFSPKLVLTALTVWL